MRHSLTVLITLAIVAITVSVAHATFVPYYGALYFSNIMAPNNSTNPYDTTNGLLWINTGSGPVENTQNVNMELLCGPASGADAGQLAPMELLNWYNGGAETGSQYALNLLSDGTGTGDVTNVGAGHFSFQGQYNELVCQLTAGVNSGTQFNYQAQFWTGNYSSYSAAVASGAAGVYARETPVFQNDFVDDTSSHTLPPIPGDLDELPAVIMTAVAVPEPGTLALLAAGLVALAGAYVARKRR